jgi:hypothetical protein
MIHAAARMELRSKMPLMRYFLFVGAALLALLFATDLYAPKPSVTAATETAMDYLPVVRIRSDRKWPERIVFDTSISAAAPAITAATAAGADGPVPTNAAVVPPSTRVRDAFAQLDPAYPKRPEPKLQQKPRTAKSRVAAPTILIAQHQRSGLPVNTTW